MKILVIQYPPENEKFVRPIRIDMETGAGSLNRNTYKAFEQLFVKLCNQKEGGKK